MKLLAFDTSTDQQFIAVQHGDEVRSFQGPGSAQSSPTLIPTIHRLMTEVGLSFDALDAIVFGRGPGSFTGLRTACSVAQGLAFAARQGLGVPVLPVDTLLAVAEEARHTHGCTLVTAVLDARMDEVYAATFRWQGEAPSGLAPWDAPADFELLHPEQVLPPGGAVVAGNAQPAYGERLAPHAQHVPALPTATALLRLAPALLAAGQGVAAADALPRYIRDKVAQTTAERAAAKAAALATGSTP